MLIQLNVSHSLSRSHHRNLDIHNVSSSLLIIERMWEEAGSDERQIETYDPDNKDDIFAVFSHRITDLRFKYSTLPSKKRPTDCSICYEVFNKDEEVIKLDCRHVFHEKCLLDWFKHNRTCPMCRVENRHALPLSVFQTA